ncbi:MAG: nitrate reductase molybdenum cofactor assembly chaperone [Elusimicrobia bacterium]|nr:nitrate reductase molybdenum cofactor assembly chaperone [Elusimicrobiota bacterium]
MIARKDSVGNSTSSEALGALLRYPDEELPARLAEAKAAAPESAQSFLAAFAAGAGTAPLRELEEIYTRTFDMNPDCSLDVGWHLYGEQYERGAFLVEMRQRMRGLGLKEDHELPDHLSHALAVHSRMEPGEARRFSDGCLRPAVEKILAGLGQGLNPYRHILSAILASLGAPATASPGA